MGRAYSEEEGDMTEWLRIWISLRSLEVNCDNFALGIVQPPTLLEAVIVVAMGDEDKSKT